jgi:hypothetical protein
MILPYGFKDSSGQYIVVVVKELINGRWRIVYDYRFKKYSSEIQIDWPGIRIYNSQKEAEA